MATLQFARVTQDQVDQLAAAGGDAAVAVYLVAQRAPWHLGDNPTVEQLAAACRRSRRRLDPVVGTLCHIGALTRARNDTRASYTYTVSETWRPATPGNRWFRIPDELVVSVTNGNLSLEDLGRLVYAITRSSWWHWETTRSFDPCTREVADQLHVAPATVQRSYRLAAAAGLFEREGLAMAVSGWVQERTWAKPRREPASKRTSAKTCVSVQLSRAHQGLSSGLEVRTSSGEKTPLNETASPATPHGASPRRGTRTKTALPTLHPMAQRIIALAGLDQKQFRTATERDLWGALACEVLDSRTQPRSVYAVVAAEVREGYRPGRYAVVWEGLKRGERVRFDDCDRRLVTCSCGFVYGGPDLFGAGHCPACGTTEGEPHQPRDEQHERDPRWAEASAQFVASHSITRSAPEEPRTTVRTVGDEPTGADRRSAIVQFITRNNASALMAHIKAGTVDEIVAAYEPRVAWDRRALQYVWRETLETGRRSA